MAGVTGKIVLDARWRLSRLAGHFTAVNEKPSNGSTALRGASSSMKDRYHRIHGEVSAETVVWRTVRGESGEVFSDIMYEKAVGEAIAKITINRPERRNAFRPLTIKELIWAFNDARDDSSIGVIILTGKGTKAFCSGGDQALRRKDGYADFENFGRLNVLDLQVQIRRLPKPVIAMVAGYAVGGGHVLHMVCDLTIAADNAIFGQTGPKVGSFDAGYGSSIMSRLIGPKKAREMWFLARFYNAVEAEKMGLINTVVPLENLEKETVQWCREILRNSPTAIRVLKAAINAVDDGHAGLQELGGNATLIFYGTEEELLTAAFPIPQIYRSRRFAVVPRMAESKPVMRKPEFIKVDQLRPGRQSRMAECLVGDETGMIVFTARNDQVDLMKAGTTVILRNAKIDMFKGSMRLVVDKWGRIEVTEPAVFTVKEDNNLSLIEKKNENKANEGSCVVDCWGHYTCKIRARESLSFLGKEILGTHTRIDTNTFAASEAAILDSDLVATGY
ncbi:hypothetical protein Nepgr_022562 [Nepenthes gracilis]|uniref:1,4-dihydroxy-2-naphthoyl-CoA synthase n=1 Tax=Nepenthes gracilis TaxID=150966 RepID=A0AAD3SZV1_NEPGR|nr:hypothetical protein Nepgr_022562 [Nepenthes gracilis]